MVVVVVAGMVTVVVVVMVIVLTEVVEKAVVVVVVDKWCDRWMTNRCINCDLPAAAGESYLAQRLFLSVASWLIDHLCWSLLLLFVCLIFGTLNDSNFLFICLCISCRFLMLSVIYLEVLSYRKRTSSKVLKKNNSLLL